MEIYFFQNVLDSVGMMTLTLKATVNQTNESEELKMFVNVVAAGEKEQGVKFEQTVFNFTLTEEMPAETYVGTIGVVGKLILSFESLIHRFRRPRPDHHHCPIQSSLLIRRHPTPFHLPNRR